MTLVRIERLESDLIATPKTKDRLFVVVIGAGSSPLRNRGR